MTNHFKDVEYRELVGAPGWAPPVYKEWTPVPASIQNMRFASGTQFRMKPTVSYAVEFNATKEVAGYSTYDVKQNAVDFVATLLENSTDPISVKRVEISKDFHTELFNRNVQFRILGTATKWQSISGFQTEGYNGELSLRVRPDYYYRVSTIDNLVVGHVEFDDVERVAEYVNNRIRTEGLDFQVRKIRYV